MLWARMLLGAKNMRQLRRDCEWRCLDVLAASSTAGTLGSRLNAAVAAAVYWRSCSAIRSRRARHGSVRKDITDGGFSTLSF